MKKQNNLNQNNIIVLSDYPCHGVSCTRGGYCLYGVCYCHPNTQWEICESEYNNLYQSYIYIETICLERCTSSYKSVTQMT